MTRDRSPNLRTISSLKLRVGGGMMLGVVACSLLFGATIVTASADTTAPSREDRITHYAFISTGPSVRTDLERSYWRDNQFLHRLLRAYGYPDEAIFRLSEFGARQGEGVDGLSSLENFRRVFRHLARITKSTDHVFIFIIGHGNPAGGDFVHTLIKGDLTAGELGELCGLLPAREITIALNPCYSGGFLPKLSAPGRVIITSTSDSESNKVDWAGRFERALDFQNRPGSIKDAYNAALAAGTEMYGAMLEEHPLLDDNGDGVGHFGEGRVVGGDGSLAAKRFLGDSGRRLVFSDTALATLRAMNSILELDTAIASSMAPGRYVIRNAAGGRCLDAAARSAGSNGCTVALWNYAGDSNQQWNVFIDSYGLCIIRNTSGNLCLDAHESLTTEDGCPVQMWRYWGGLNQRWIVEPAGAGLFAIRNASGDRCLDAWEAVTGTDGCPVQLWRYWGGRNQHWLFEKVEGQADR